MLTTVGDRCGIAAYSRALLDALSRLPDVTIELVPIEPGRQPDSYYVSQAEQLNLADVVHVQHEHSFWGGILPNKSAFWQLRYLIRKPLVITAHTTTALRDLLKTPQERRPIHRLAKEILGLRVSYRDSVEIAPFITGRCIVHTREGGEALVARGANGKYIHVIPAGVPDPIDAPMRGVGFRGRFTNGGPIVSLFGYLAPNKGYEIALDSLSVTKPNVNLLIAGGARNSEMAPFEQKLRADIESRGLGTRVYITGHLTEEEIAEAMATSDLVIAPHTIATGSYSIMVPLAYHKAIIASDLACFREIAAAAPCIRLFKSGSSAVLAKAINEVLASETERADLERLAGEFAAAHSWNTVAEQTVAVYRAALADETRLSHIHSAAA